MGMSVLMVDLPRSWSRQSALAAAAEALREHGIPDWSRLELRTTTATGTDLIRRFTFTYWTDATPPGHVQDLRYTTLWERLDRTERAALVTSSSGTAAERVTDTLVRLGGDHFLVPGRNGTSMVPRSLRDFLRAMNDGRR
ncbi:hypothetical protein EEB14_52440 [Rhodococcus sp. WS4]|nr:hypothetical protein EEB14_52440 [Rhodococcus sp. WS4]